MLEQLFGSFILPICIAGSSLCLIALTADTINKQHKKDIASALRASTITVIGINAEQFPHVVAYAKVTGYWVDSAVDQDDRIKWQ